MRQRTEGGNDRHVSQRAVGHDAVNPVFGQTREDDTWGVGFILFDRKIFNSTNWIGQATLVVHKQSSNIAFYEASSATFALGAQYRF